VRKRVSDKKKKKEKERERAREGKRKKEKKAALRTQRAESVAAVLISRKTEGIRPRLMLSGSISLLHGERVEIKKLKCCRGSSIFSARDASDSGTRIAKENFSRAPRRIIRHHRWARSVFPGVSPFSDVTGKYFHTLYRWASACLSVRFFLSSPSASSLFFVHILWPLRRKPAYLLRVQSPAKILSGI